MERTGRFMEMIVMLVVRGSRFSVMENVLAKVSRSLICCDLNYNSSDFMLSRTSDLFLAVKQA